MQGTGLSSDALLPLVLTTTLRGTYYLYLSRDEETKASRIQVPCPQSYGVSRWSWDLNPSDSPAHVLTTASHKQTPNESNKSFTAFNWNK